MKKLFIIVATIFLLGTAVEKAHAFYVVDTGVDPEMGVLINGNYGVALQFSLDQDYKVTSIESVVNGYNGTLSLAVFSDNADFPDYTDELFRQNVFIPESDPPAWQGLIGMNLDLDAGSYWVTWDSFSNPFIGSMIGGAIYPLEHNMYLFVDPDTDPLAYYELTPDINLTLRIGAERQGEATVPEPATMVLLGSGLIGAALSRRKRS